jgi:hypothetical protein
MTVDSRGDRCRNRTFCGVCLDDDPVLAQLLLDQYNLLGALNHKIPARIEWALVHPRQLLLRLTRQHTLVAPQHARYPADRHIRPLDEVFAARVLDRNVDRGAVRSVSQTALVRRDGLVDGVRVRAIGHADGDVRVFQPEARVDVRGDFVVGAKNVEKVNVDEMVERVDVLLYEPFDFEKGGE